MATSRTHRFLQHLRQAVVVSDGAGLSDGQLLDRYVSTRDEAAFAALVRRHGPMVLGVCRRLLRDQHDADDAFQATFLVLVKKAASVVPAEMLPNWLHGVARQTAVRARSAAAKRRFRERPLAEMPEPQAAQTDPSDDLRPLLDSELASLPSKYRIAVVLCDLEGMTHQGAANRLGWPLGTLASRHSRGRRMLKERLARRGLVPAGGASAVWFGGGPASVPPSLVSSTVQAGSLYWAGPAVAGGAISLTVAALTEGVLKAMSLKKIKSLAAVLLMVSMVALGGGLLARNPAADEPSVQQDRQPGPDAAVQGGKKVVAADKPKERKDRLEVRAEGKEVRVWAVFGDEALHAVANRMSYTEGGLLVLEGNVKMQKRRGNEVDDIRGDKVVIDRRSGRVKVERASGVRIEVPALGPVPVALDFGFPVIEGLHDKQQVFNFFLGFTR